jgi:hypothetical protein
VDSGYAPATVQIGKADAPSEYVAAVRPVGEEAADVARLTE